MLKSKKTFFIYAIFFVFIFFSGNVLANDFSLENKNSDYVKDLSFSLHDDQYLTTGSSDKLVLKDNEGNLWIFKLTLEYKDPEEYFGVPCVQGDNFFTKFYKIMGINTPNIYPVIFTINGEKRFGSLVGLIPDIKSGVKNDDFSGLSLFEKQYIQKVFILDWFFGIAGTDAGDFIRAKHSDEVWTFDKEHAYRDALVKLNKMKVNNDINDFLDNPVFSKFYKRFFDYLKQSGSEVDLDEIFAFIDDFQSIDNNVMHGLLVPYLRLINKVKYKWVTAFIDYCEFDYSVFKIGPMYFLCEVNCYRKFLRKIKDREVETYFLKLKYRKEHMREIFAEFYAELLNIEKGQIPNNFGERGQIVKKINDDLMDLSKFGVAGFIDKTEQGNIEVIFSDKGWFFCSVMDRIGAKQAIKQLRKLKEDVCPNEKKAIDIYIGKIKSGSRFSRVILCPKQ